MMMTMRVYLIYTSSHIKMSVAPMAIWNGAVYADGGGDAVKCVIIKLPNLHALLEGAFSATQHQTTEVNTTPDDRSQHNTRR